MTKVTLDDLKFIEDKKNRRAFLIALREVEAEGFDLAEANAAAKKIHEIETTPVEVNESKREGIDLKTVGATPAERAAASGHSALRLRGVLAPDPRHAAAPVEERPEIPGRCHHSRRDRGAGGGLRRGL